MFKTPILFLIFNRPDTTKQVLAKIREIQPKYLYLAADGPRLDRIGEQELCEQTRKLVLDAIDWKCEVKTLFREQNLGCKNAVSSAINWFFEQVEMGIILEDDCLPELSFFHFQSFLLDKFKDDKQIISINGCNLGFEYKPYSFLYSKFMNMWGWGTWRRSVNLINYDIPEWDLIENKEKYLKSRLKLNIFDFDDQWLNYWSDIFERLHEIDTWDWQWIFYQLYYNQLAIVPAVNLVKNIGFDNRATHTTDSFRSIAKMEIQNIGFPLNHNPNKSISFEYEIFLKDKWIDIKHRNLLDFIKNKLLYNPYINKLNLIAKKK